MDHLALAVSDQARSTRFYTHYFGFVPEPEPREDGVLILHDAAGFSLALGEIDEPIVLPRFFHFGRRASSAGDVRAFRERVEADGLEIVEWWDEHDYVSVKFRDPDGYVIEVGWEPDASSRRRAGVPGLREARACSSPAPPSIARSASGPDSPSPCPTSRRSGSKPASIFAGVRRRRRCTPSGAVPPVKKPFVPSASATTSVRAAGHHSADSRPALRALDADERERASGRLVRNDDVRHRQLPCERPAVALCRSSSWITPAGSPSPCNDARSPPTSRARDRATLPLAAGGGLRPPGGQAGSLGA